MKMVVIVAVAMLTAMPSYGQGRQGGSAKGTGAAEPREVVREGELETYIAIGGESTGWRLRTRTPDGRRQLIEVLLTAEVAQGVRANTRVQVRGTMQTRHYVERGDVPVLVAKSVIEVARR